MPRALLSPNVELQHEALSRTAAGYHVVVTRQDCLGRVTMRNTRHRALIQLLVALPALGLIKPAVVAAHTCAKGNCVNGQGLLVYPDGGSYEGQFKDGRFEGRGIKIFDDGGSYEGESREAATRAKAPGCGAAARNTSATSKEA